MTRSCVVIALVLLATASAATAAEAVVGNLVFLQSPDARGKFSRSKMACSMMELVREMKLPRNQLPLVLVLHVSATAAQAAGLEQSTVRLNSGNTGDPYYEFWIIGAVDTASYTVAFERLLEHHFSLALTDADRKSMITRVIRHVDATISAYSE